MTEEEMMAVNCIFERYRKARKRAGQDIRHIIEQAGKSLFVLERTHNDNMINRWISTPIAVSESKDELIAFCHKLYGAEVEFNPSLIPDNYFQQFLGVFLGLTVCLSATAS